MCAVGIFVLFCSLNKYLSSTYYVPGTVLGAKAPAVSKTNILVEEWGKETNF